MGMKIHKPFGRSMTTGLLRVSLCDRSPEVARSLADLFDDADEVEVIEGNLLDLDCDALVSPANSFGFMDGGIDKAIDRFYEGAAQRAVMDRIADRFHGELPVGSATVIGMKSRRFPFLIVSPTMRIPGDVQGTINAYLAMRAALAAVLDHQEGSGRITSVAIPGLGTGVGGMSGEASGVQMRAAYDMIVRGEWRKIAHPASAPFALHPKE
jgi:O-acetyl-ADP-ribose deacetylase (regulator of RNase III)